MREGIPARTSFFAARKLYARFALLAFMALLCFSLAACQTPPQAEPDDSATEASTPSAAEDDFRLADLSNPFLGEWQSDIPSAGTTLKFNYKTDGTFEYEMEGVPESEGGKGSGGYIVYDNVHVTWLDFEGAAAYNFEVIDNDTINVTELVPNDAGEFVPGSTSPFTRVPGSDVNKEDIPFTLDNPLIGKWQSEAPDVEPTIMDYKADGTFDYEMVGAPADQGGKGSGSYIIYEDKMIGAYYGYPGAESFTFKVADDGTIQVTQYIPDGTGGFTAGETALFTPIND